MNKLRLAILGPKLYEKCSTFYAEEKEIRQHLKEMTSSPEYLKRLQEVLHLKCKDASSSCIVDTLIQACEFKSSQVEKQRCFDVQTCFERDFYQQNQSNLYCNIYRLDCSDNYHKANLAYFQRIEREQEEHFVDFLSLNADGCGSDKYVYYIAFNTETETLCGVALTKLVDGYVYIHFLTSRAAPTNTRKKSLPSQLFKGVGSSIIKAIIHEYQDNPDVFGIKLLAVDDAIPFYKRIGFKFLQTSMNEPANQVQKYDDNYKMIYLFDELQQNPFNESTFNKDSKRTKLYLKSLLLDDPNEVEDSLIQAFKKHDVVLQPDEVDELVKISYYGLKYFFDDLRLNDLDKQNYLLGWPKLSMKEKRHYNSFHTLTFLYQKNIITIDDILKVFDNSEMFNKLTRQQLNFTANETYMYIVDILEQHKHLANMLKKYYGSQNLMTLRNQLTAGMQLQLDIVIAQVLLAEPIPLPVDEEIILALDNLVANLGGGQYTIHNPALIRLYNIGVMIKNNLTDMLIQFLEYEENLKLALASLYLYIVLSLKDVQYLFNSKTSFMSLIEFLHNLNNKRNNTTVPIQSLLPSSLKRLIVKKVMKTNSCYAAERLLNSPFNFQDYELNLISVCIPAHHSVPSSFT